MSGKDAKWTGSCVIEGEMQDETICVRTGAGGIQRLWKDAPPHQRASFFDRVFAEMANEEPAMAGSSAFASLRATFRPG